LESISDSNSLIIHRNAWALANYCIKSQESIEMKGELLRGTLVYLMTNKEKVVANAIRALGSLFSADITQIEILLKGPVFKDFRLPPKYGSR